VDSFPWSPTIAGGYARMEGEVVGDTFHGWHRPDGHLADGLALTKVTVDDQPRPDLVMELSVLDPKRTCLPVDLKGQRVLVMHYERAPYEDVDHMTGGVATVLRNVEGQLLWAGIGGSLDEHGAEALPELRTVRMPSGAPVREHPCYGVGGKMGIVHQQAARVMLSSPSESKVFDENTALHSISIGCVEYLVVLQASDVVAMEGCRDSQYSFSMSIIRRALLEPGPGCTP